ncbi:MAG: nucleotide exchange factor GrpE [Bacteroidota bacterium]
MSKKDKHGTERHEESMNENPNGNAENLQNGDSTAESGNGQTPEAEASSQQVEEFRKQVDELKDKYMRLYAEFENFKKRSIREKIDWMKSAAQDTLTALLPVLDDFDRAKKFGEANNGGLSEGMELVYQKLYSTLKNRGLEPMESTGQPFDPELHDAITEIPAPTEDLKGKVLDTIEKGYRLNDKIIRHAKVVVGK